MLSFSFGRGNAARPLEILIDNMTFCFQPPQSHVQKGFFKVAVHFSLTPVSVLRVPQACWTSCVLQGLCVFALSVPAALRTFTSCWPLGRLLFFKAQLSSFPLFMEALPYSPRLGMNASPAILRSILRPPVSGFWRYSFIGTWTCSFINTLQGCLCVTGQRRAVAKSPIFTTWPFTGKVCLDPHFF